MSMTRIEPKIIKDLLPQSGCEFNDGKEHVWEHDGELDYWICRFCSESIRDVDIEP